MSDILSSSAFDSENKSNGIIGIKDGRVTVTDPTGGGSPALLFPVEKAAVAVNGREIEGPTEVFAADMIEIVPLRDIIPPSVRVEIAPDAMSASLQISPRVVVTRKITDQPLQEKLTPVLSEDKEQFREITAEDATLEMKKNGVIFGIQESLIREIADEADGMWHLAARGEAPENGVDGYIEPAFTQGLRKIIHDEKDLSKVDYRERFSSVSVEEGDILGTLHPAVPGKQGMTVRGEWLDPPEVQEERARCGPGCKLVQVETGGLIIATQNGRPLMERNDDLFFSVSPLLIHREDVDLKSGNLRFKGDLQILGDIVEGMTIESWGNLEVTGRTAGSDLFCGGGAIFSNYLINSSVAVGVFKDVYLKLNPLLDKLEDVLIDILQGIEQIEQPMTEGGEETEQEETEINAEELIRRLLDRSRELVEELCEKALKIPNKTKISLPVSFERNLRETCSCFLQAIRREKAEKADFIDVLKLIKDSGTIVKKWELSPADLKATYVQNCRIYSSGNIRINEGGSYNSHYVTPMNVYIEGFFRGGSITAGGEVFISEAGSPALPLKQGVITLNPGAAAYFHRVYENVRVVFDQCEYKFPLTKTMVKVHYDEEDDRVIVTPYKNQ